MEQNDQTDEVAVDAAQAAHDALARGDFDALAAVLDDDVVWHSTVEGAAGTYRGRDAVLAALRSARGLGPTEAATVASAEEPEVALFAFTGGISPQYVSTQINRRGECAEVTTIFQVDAAKITSFGSMPTLSSF